MKLACAMLGLKLLGGSDLARKSKRKCQTSCATWLGTCLPSLMVLEAGSPTSHWQSPTSHWPSTRPGQGSSQWQQQWWGPHREAIGHSSSQRQQQQQWGPQKAARGEEPPSPCPWATSSHKDFRKNDACMAGHHKKCNGRSSHSDFL